jgi:hypothetical protein
MNPALVAMIILGCNHGEADCSFIREVDTRFETEAACQSNADAELERTGQSRYPVVMAICKMKPDVQQAESAAPAVEEKTTGPQVIMAPEPEASQPGDWAFRRIAHSLAGAVQNTRKAVVGGFRFIFGSGKMEPSDPIDLSRQG